MISGLNEEKDNDPLEKLEFKFAKNRKQAIAAIVIFTIFILKVGFTGYSYYHQAQMDKQNTDQAAMLMSDNQQKNLESLGGNVPNTKDVQKDANDIYSKTLSLQGKNPQTTGQPSPQAPPAVGSSEDIEIVSKKASNIKNNKTILISVSDSGRSNPFLPPGENIAPSSLPKFNLIAPPEQLASDPDANNVIGTTISGILYDKYSPSAIINIAGTDYLVKRGDVINRYKIITINKDQVVVQLGKNIYKAGVGQLLAQDQINYNSIANLEKKFGGNEISISVKKKGY